MSQARLLSESLAQHVRNQGDVFVAADLPVVFEDATSVVAYLVVAQGTSPTPRDRWSIALEGAPDVLVARAGSPAAEPARWADVGVRELFVFDPETRTIAGHWLGPRGFAAISPEDGGRVPCEELRLHFGFQTAPGAEPVLRFFTRAGELLETPDETEAKRRAKIARLIATHDADLDEYNEEQRQK